MFHLKKWDLVAISSVPLIMTLGNSMFIPILPTIQKQLNITSFQVSMIITVYSIIAIVLIPLAGFLSDQFGRKNVIIPSLIITAAGGLVSGLAAWLIDNSYVWILVGRLLQGVGAAGAFPIVMPLVGDMFHAEEEVSSGLGLIETSNTFGKVLSPIAGAFIGSILWYLPFLTIPAFCLLSILMMLFLVKTPKKQGKPQKFSAFIQSIIGLFKEKGRWLYAIFAAGGIGMFVLFGVLFYLSSLLERSYGIDGVKKGLILAIPLLALCLTSFATGRAIGENKLRMKWVAFTGASLMTVGILVGAMFAKLVWLLAALCVGGIGIGLMLPPLDAFITEGIEKKERGTITALYSSMRFIGVALGPPVVSVLEQVSHPVLFFTLTGVCLVAAVCTLFAIKPKSNAPEDLLSDAQRKRLWLSRLVRS